MPDFTVVIKAEYVIIDVETPREAIETAFRRSQHPDKLDVQAAEDA